MVIIVLGPQQRIGAAKGAKVIDVGFSEMYLFRFKSVRVLRINALPLADNLGMLMPGTPCENDGGRQYKNQD